MCPQSDTTINWTRVPWTPLFVTVFSPLSFPYFPALLWSCDRKSCSVLIWKICTLFVFCRNVTSSCKSQTFTKQCLGLLLQICPHPPPGCVADFFCCLHPWRPHTHQHGLMQVLMCHWNVLNHCQVLQMSKAESPGKWSGIHECMVSVCKHGYVY